jgi:hypothetical protein
MRLEVWSKHGWVCSFVVLFSLALVLSSMLFGAAVYSDQMIGGVSGHGHFSENRGVPDDMKPQQCMQQRRGSVQRDTCGGLRTMSAVGGPMVNLQYVDSKSGNLDPPPGGHEKMDIRLLAMGQRLSRMPLVPVVLTPALLNLGAGTNSLRWATSRDWGVGRSVHSDGAPNIAGGVLNPSLPRRSCYAWDTCLCISGASYVCGASAQSTAVGQCIQVLVGTPVPRVNGGQYETVFLERKGGDVGGFWYGGGCHDVGCGQEGCSGFCWSSHLHRAAMGVWLRP